MPITSDDRYLMDGINKQMTDEELVIFRQKVKDRYFDKFDEVLKQADKVLLTLSFDLSNANSKLLYSEALQARENIKSIIKGMELL